MKELVNGKAKSSATRFSWPEWSVFAVYCCLVAWAVAHHESWADEAQAWLIARDSSLGEIFYRRLHYEGTAGLWHLLLWLEIHMFHVSFDEMRWITAALVAAAVFVLLRFARLPRWIKLLLPFTAAMLYLGPVIARSYSLILVLVTLLCVTRRAERPRPVLYVALIGLLANTSAFGAVLAAGYLIEYLLSFMSETPPLSRRTLTQAAAVTVLLWVAAIYTGLPATDAHFAFTAGIRRHTAVARTVSRLTGVVHPVLDQPDPRLHPDKEPPPHQDQPLPMTPVQRGLHALIMPAHITSLTHAYRALALSLGFVFFTISPSNLLGIAFFTTLFAWLIRHGTLRYAIPYLLLTVVGVHFYVAAHHALVWWFALTGLIWLAWPTKKQHTSLVDIVFQVVLGVVLVQQIVFGIYAIDFEGRHPFDGGKELVALLRSEPPGKTVEAYMYFPVSAQPYFSRNIFSNHAHTYWPFTLGLDPAMVPPHAAKSRPDIVLTAETFGGSVDPVNQLYPVARAYTAVDGTIDPKDFWELGYIETHRFCGFQPFDLGTSAEICQLVFERRAADPKP